MRLVADIGATNMRIAVVSESHQVGTTEHYLVEKFDGPCAAINNFVESNNLPPPVEVYLGVAAPISGDRINFTNCAWAFSAKQLKQQLSLSTLGIVNDIPAWAYGLLNPEPKDIQQIGGRSRQDGGAKGFIIPGTGLGVAGMIPYRNEWLPIPSESGYTELSGEHGYRYEKDILAYIAARHGRTSAERLLSGTGLQEIFTAVTAISGQETPLPSSEEITRLALARTCQHSTNTAATYLSFLGEFSGSVALTYSTVGGVYIAGNIANALAPLVHQSSFRERFEAKGRATDFVASIPCFWVSGTNSALQGLASLMAVKHALPGMLLV